MRQRTAFLDESIGERRGVVLLDGKPERLIIERAGQAASQRLGARSIARVVSSEPGLGMMFLTMPDGPDAIAPLPAGQNLVEGSSWEVTVTAEPRAGKGPVVDLGVETVGPPRLIESAKALPERLRAYAGRDPETGLEAREAADEAQEAALETVHSLPGGGNLCIERTRALTAIDVDMGEVGGGDAVRAQRKVNLAAIVEGARLLRLKALGGLVVFDLVGQGHNGPLLHGAARTAFVDDGPGVAFGPISRFGLMEMALPWRFTPVVEILAGSDGSPSPQTAALALLRAIEREARADPGGRIVARCSPAIGEEAKPLIPALAGRIGARFRLETVPGLPNMKFEVKCL